MTTNLIDIFTLFDSRLINPFDVSQDSFKTSSLNAKNLANEIYNVSNIFLNWLKESRQGCFNLNWLVFCYSVLPVRLIEDAKSVWLVDYSILGVDAQILTEISDKEWVWQETSLEDRRILLWGLVLSRAFSVLMKDLMTGYVTPLHMNQEQALIVFISRLFANETAELKSIIEDDPEFLTWLLTLAKKPWLLPDIQCCILNSKEDTLSVDEVWSPLIQILATLNADERPLYLWLAPLDVSCVISPYVRDTRSLLVDWINTQQDSLPVLKQAMESGIEDAFYVCADLFCKHFDEVQHEREQAEATSGIFTVRNKLNKPIVQICDTQHLNLSDVDSRINYKEKNTHNKCWPIVIILNQNVPIIAGAFLTRLIQDVQANYRHCYVCVQSLVSLSLIEQISKPESQLYGSEQLSFSTAYDIRQGIITALPYIRNIPADYRCFIDSGCLLSALFKSELQQLKMLSLQAQELMPVLLYLIDNRHLPCKDLTLDATYYSPNHDLIFDKQQLASYAARVWSDILNTEDKLLPEKDDTPKQRLEDDGEDWTLGLSLPESTKEERLSSRMKDKTENKPKQIPSRFHLRV